MSLKADRAVAQSHSQLLVEDPDAFVQRLKRRLALKEGLPESQQRLIFSVTSTDNSNASSAAEKSAEDIVSELHSWQAIVYRNNKAVGRLVAPQISAAEVHNPSVSPSRDSETVSEEKGVAVEIISIVYDQWQPVWLRNKAQLKPLYLPVDKVFQESSYRIQVIGQSKGNQFAVPVSYTFNGGVVASALSVETQRAEYIRKHQRARGEDSEGLKHLRSISVKCGRGLGGFTTVFDVEDQPAWLKSISLSFAVVASKVLDEGGPDTKQFPMSGSTIQIATPELERKVQQGSSSAEQESRESWLPKVVGPAPSRGRKSRGKQRGKKVNQNRRDNLSISAPKPLQREAQTIADTSAAPGLNQTAALVEDKGEGPSQFWGGSSSEEESPEEFAPAGLYCKQKDQTPSPGIGVSTPVRDTESKTQAGLSTAGAKGPPLKVDKSPVARKAGVEASTPVSAAQNLGDTTVSSGASEKLAGRTAQGSSLVSQPSGHIKIGGPSSGSVRPGVGGRSNGSPPALATPRIKPTADQEPCALVSPPSETRPAAPKPLSRLRRAEITTTPRVDNLAAAVIETSLAQDAAEREDPTAEVVAEGPQLEALKRPDLERRMCSANQRCLSEALEAEQDGCEEQQGSSSSSDDSLQTAFSELGGSPRSTDAQGPQPIPLLAHAGNSGAHSSTGASLRTYGSADSGRSGLMNDEETLVSALPGPYQIPHNVARPSASPAFGHVVAAPSSQPSDPPADPTAEDQESAVAATIPSVDQVQPAAQTLTPAPEERATTSADKENPSTVQPAEESSNGARGSDFQNLPNTRGNARGHNTEAIASPLWDAVRVQALINDYGMSEAASVIPAGSAPDAGPPLRVRPHSSVDLTQRAAETTLAYNGTAVNSNLQAKGVPSRGSVYPSSASMLEPGEARGDQGLQNLRLNGYTPGASPRNHEDNLRQWYRHDFRSASPVMRPYSASSPRFEGRAGSRTLSHDSLADPGARALLAELHKVRASMGGGDGSRSGRSGFMTPPPPPPPRMPPLDALNSSLSQIERQGSFQVPQPSQSTVFDSHGQPACDLERLLSCVTPVVMLKGKPVLEGEERDTAKLADVWSFFEEASSYGREVHTRSGRRGPALAYYTPFLSAIRAFRGNTAPTEGSQVREIHVCPLVHHFETEPPFNRDPLAEAVLHTAADPLSGLKDVSWHDFRICDLHPASWFAVAWYPIYRIPDAPLVAKFLTYHSLRPVPSSQTYFGVANFRGHSSSNPDAASAASPLCLPILGLKCAELKGEPWLEMYSQSPSARTEWESRLEQLQMNADSLSAGIHLRMLNAKGEWEQPRQTHSDLEWFNRHP